MDLATIADLTIRELLRRRVLGIAAILTILAILASAWGLWRIEAAFADRGAAHAPGSLLTFSVIVSLLAFAFSFVLAIAAAFLGASSLSNDIDSGLLLAIVPRPLSRTEFALGRWSALALVLIAYGFAGAGIELALVAAISGYVPPHPWLALGYLAWETLALLTLAFFFGTRLPALAGAIAAVAAFGVAWISGIIGAVASDMGQTTLYHATTVVRLLIPTDGIWRAALFSLEPVVVADVAGASHAINPFSSDAPPAPAFLLWCAAWTVGVLALALAGFRRREL